MVIELFFDGACEPKNPGGTATYGWVLYGVPGFNAEVTGRGLAAEGEGATNNVAEYAGLGHALTWLSKLPPLPKDATLVIRGDSQLVINQIAGEWACNSPHLAKMLARCQELIAKIGVKSQLLWVSREQNVVADMLTRAAYEQATALPFPERAPKKK